jgi:hypothetical protein
MLTAAAIQLTPTQLAWERTLDDVTVGRVLFLEDAEHDTNLQRAALERCEQDPLWFFDNFCYATDPRRPELGLEADTPFVPFEEQRVMFLALVLGYSLALDKSRDTGASFVLAFFYAWCLRFRPGTTWGLSSKTGDDADNGTPSSLLGKVEFALNSLPWWMQPKSWSVKHSPHGQITNHDNRARCIAKRTTATAWHSDRCTAVCFDEIARTPNSQTMVNGAKGTANQTILITTPNGSTDWWASLMRGEADEEIVELDPAAVMRGERPESIYYHMQLSWMQDPRYDEGWAEQKARSMSRREWLINYMCSYAASTEGLIWHQFVRQKHILSDDDWKEFLRDYLRDADIYEGWDNGLYSSVIWAAHLKSHNVLIVLGGISWFEAGTRVIARDVSEYRAPWCPQGIRTKANEMGLLPKVRVGDPAMRKKSELNLHTFIGDLRKEGIRLGAPATVAGKTKQLRDTIGDALEDMLLFFSPLCTKRWGKLPSIVDAVEQYHLLYRPGDNDPEPDKDHPSSHPADALQYIGLTAWPKGKPAGIYRSRNGQLERVDPSRDDTDDRRWLRGQDGGVVPDSVYHGFDVLEV